MQTFNRSIFLLGSGLVLMACGSGGGGGSQSASSVPEPSIAITAANAESVTSRLVSSVESMGSGGGGEAISFSDFGNPAPISVSGVRFGPTEELCPVSGSFTSRGDTRSDDVISAGDYVITDFSGCNFGEGFTLDGEQVLTFGSTIDPFGDIPNRIILSMEYSGFKTTLPSEATTVTMNGDLSIDLNLSNANFDTSIITSDQLSLAYQSPSDSDTVTLYEVRSVSTDNYSTGRWTTRIEGTFESQGMNGAVTFETLADVEGDSFFNDFDTGAIPDAGQLLITGTNNSTILLTILSSASVSLDIDENGDGVVDETILTTWQAIDLNLFGEDGATF